MDWINQLLSMMTLVFAIASIVAGIFTAYFGSGKSRIVGAILIILGLVVFLFFLWGAGLMSSLSFMGTPAGIFNFQGYIVQGIVAILGAVIGAAIALGIFLLAIMKA